MRIAIPGVDACQIDVLPAQRRDVLEQMIRNLATHFAQVGNGPFDIDRVPMDDGADDEVEAGGAERLAFERPITDFATLVEMRAGSPSPTSNGSRTVRSITGPSMTSTKSSAP